MKKLLSLFVLLVAIVTGAWAATESISWAITTNQLTITPTITPSVGANLSNASTTITLKDFSSSSSQKDGYCKPFYKTAVEFDATKNFAQISFVVADGYTFTPTSLGMTVFSHGTGNLKYKVVISDSKAIATSVTSNEIQPSSGGEAAITFADGAFTGKTFEGTVTIKLYAYNYSNSSSGKRTYIKSPITISGTTAAKTPEVKYDVTYKAGAGTGDDVVENVSEVGDCPEGFTAPTGKRFTGWNTESDGTGTAYAVGAAVESALTLYAQWAKFYSVNYNLGAASAGTVPTQTDIEEGKTFTVAAAPSDLVPPTGKEFVKWNDGSTDYNAGDTYTVGTSDVTLTAVYQDRTYQGLTPSQTLDFTNLGSTFSTMWFDNGGKMKKNFDFDAANGKVVISAYAIYQSNAQDRNLNLWATTDSGNSSTTTWSATGDFKGSSYYFNDEERAANIQASARVHYYRVTGITGVSANFSGKAAIEAYEVNAGIVFPDYAKQNKITSAGTATIAELDADKEYVILVRGDNGTSGIRFYEIAFTFPAITTETITIPTEGFATYVTSSALDFSSQNGAFKAYVASSVNEAKTSVATVEVTKVPAGTALLLKGAVGSYNVEIAESADAVTNLLKASNGGVKGDNSTVFAYSKSAGKFKKVAQDVVIPAGKAYLKLEAAAANPDALDIDFGEQATGINGIAEANEAEAAPVKVIKNGKLYIGNFNVAGQQVK